MGALPVTARGRATRRALLEAAEAVFGAGGYESASISDIASQAGVAQGTFYVYFPSKKAIFVELVELLGTELRRTLAEAIADAPDRLGAEERGLRAFLAFVRRHRNLYRIVRQAEFVDEDVYRAYYLRFAEGYQGGLRAAVAAGQVGDVSVEALSYALMGVADFIGMRWVLWSEEESVPEDVIAAVMHLLRRGIGP